MTFEPMFESDANLYDFGPFRLDVQRRTLYCRNAKVALRPKTFSLLLLLLSRAGQTVTKDEIADALWPGGYVLEGNLTQQVFFLREALREAGGSREYVVTNPGTGYTFIAPVEKVRRAEPDLCNPEAYLEYVKGLSSAERRSAEGYQEAVEHFTKAIALYQEFSSAYAGLAHAFSRLATMDLLYPRDAFAKAREAAVQALNLDPRAPEALAALGQAAQFYDRDEKAAFDLLSQAVESSPRAGSLRIYLAWHLFLFGHLDRSRDQIEYVLAAEPHSPRAHFSLAMISLFAEDYELAIAMLRAVKDMTPTLYLPQFYLGTALAEAGRPGEALQIFSELPPDFLPRFTKAAVAHAQAAASNTKEARRLLQELEQLSKSCYVSHYYLARAYLVLRDDGMLRSALLKADKDADPWLIFLRAHPFWKRLSRDRFIQRLAAPRGQYAT